MATSARPRANNAAVAVGTPWIVYLPYGPSKFGVQAVGGTPSVDVTCDTEAMVAAGTATWVSVTLTNGSASIDNVYTAVRFTATVSSARCNVVWN